MRIPGGDQMMMVHGQAAWRRHDGIPGGDQMMMVHGQAARHEGYLEEIR